MQIYNSFTELIGNTPILELCNYEKNHALAGRILAKLEMMNPAGSIKDRTAMAMLFDAEEKGLIKPGATIVEPTSGNTGIGLAAVAATRGYKVILTMPASMSEERRKLLSIYGATLILTDANEGMNGAIAKAKEIAASTPGSFMPSQFANPSNPRVHQDTTGPEIWRDTDGKIDILVAGVGTGGTISGAGLYLKQKNPKIEVVAVEPKDSPVLSGGKAGAHGLQGIGAGFIPQTTDTKVIDRIICVTTEEAYAAGRALVREEGILAGISAGAALYAATLLAQKQENREKNIVVILPDTGERYLSTEMFDV